ncbi:MAG: hypothetical protein A2096_02390 [Spirochaetes bacterium GWF1_41_5]|nr:MAG: hypothetical protein A2096_02390 [Spirochaetes bacterium GWF1_41_5]HBE02753.1 heat-shock protein Hsp20 [Spirochaetia bacterium]
MWLVPEKSTLFDQVLGTAPEPEHFSPLADIIEKEDSYEIDVLLPGVARENIAVEIKNDILTVSGERKNVYAENKTRFLAESAYGKFSRSWFLEGISAESIEAEYRDGVLKILLKKQPAVMPRKIELK